MFNVFSYIREARRVLYVASRPRRREFEQIVKITGLGILIVGILGVASAEGGGVRFFA